MHTKFYSGNLNLRQNQNIWIANELFENVAKFKYLGMANQNDIHDEIKNRLNSGVLLSHMKKLEIKIHKTNFASCTVWVQNLVSHSVEGT
jgi:hypothetical protein